MTREEKARRNELFVEEFLDGASLKEIHERPTTKITYQQVRRVIIDKLGYDQYKGVLDMRRGKPLIWQRNGKQTKVIDQPEEKPAMSPALVDFLTPIPYVERERPKTLWQKLVDLLP